MYCSDVIQTTYFFFSDELPKLLYYSHIPPLIISMVLGLWIYFNDKKIIQSKVFLAVSIVFSLLTFSNLILWSNSNPEIVSFFWFLSIELFNWFLALLAYLYFVFVSGKDLAKKTKLFFFSLLALSPIILSSRLGIGSFNLSSCEVNVGNWYTSYQILINIFIALTTPTILILSFFHKKQGVRTKNLLFALAVFSFSLLFVSSWHLSAYYDTFILEQIGYIGFVIFSGILAFLIVRYKSFHMKVFASQALVGVLWVLIGSILFVAVSPYTRIITAITEIIAIIFGLILIGSVKKEIRQKEQIEKLAGELQGANTKLKALDKQKTEFLSFASHQLRSPVTAIKGYSSMILEGSFGEIGKEAKSAVDVIFQSAQKLVFVIEDFLNVTRIELGTMKYDFANADLREIVEGVVKTMKLIAESRQLSLTTEIDAAQDYKLNLDAGKISQVVSNLIDNSIKYTKTGSITVRLLRQAEKMRIEIKDTGVGIDQETMERLFQKFSRAYDATRMNANGTGLGLYVARQLVEAHKGKLWAESEGEGKGTTFIVELPVKK